MKIAILGTHGIGKTTLAYQIAAQAKKSGKNAVVINEIARRCPFPLNDEFTKEGAEWIITSQVSRELSAKAEGHDFIICDRSAFDPVMYLKVKPINPMLYFATANFAEEWLKTYDKLIFVKSSTKELLDDGVRSLDKKFQKDIDVEFIEFFKNNPKLEPIEAKSGDIFLNRLDSIYKELGIL